MIGCGKIGAMLPVGLGSCVESRISFMNPLLAKRSSARVWLRRFVVFCCVVLAVQGWPCRAETPFRPEKLREMDQAILESIANQNCPGGVLWVEHGSAAYHKAYGNRALVPSVEP